MRWIVLYQEIEGIICYTPSEAQKTALYVPIDEFLNNISKYPVKNWTDFKREINTFKTIYLNLDSGDWEIIKETKTFSDFTFEELYALNHVEEEKVEKNKFEKAKEYIRGKKI